MSAYLPVLADALVTWVYDWWLEEEPGDPGDAIARIAGMRDQFAQRIAAGYQERAEREWMLERERSAYAGRYASDEYGVLTITVDGESIGVRLGQLRCVAEPYTEPNSIRVEMVPGQGEVVRFGVDDDGKVIGMEYDETRFMKE